MREQTLVLIKPDAVRRRLIGEITRRFEAKGLDIIALKMVRFNDALTRSLYGQYAQEGFYPALCKFIQSGPSVAMILEGNDAISLVRKMVGATRHTEAASGTIRGDFATDTTANIVHGSDTLETAKREIELFFASTEVFR